jgi:hypothetical protein
LQILPRLQFGIKVPEYLLDDGAFVAESGQQRKVHILGDSWFSRALNRNASDNTSLKSEFQKLLLSFDSRLPDARFQGIRSFMSCRVR